MAAEPQALSVGVLHGPNLNLLGTREPHVYGHATLDDVNHAVREAARALGAEVEIFQSSHEGALVDFLHQAAPRVRGFVVNAAAYTHTSVALADALAGVARPYVEVHLTNVFARERFRHRSHLAKGAVGVISGFGVHSYTLGLRALLEHLRQHDAGRRAQEP